jgi:hypothetical protein
MASTTNLSAADRRAAHAAGYSSYAYKKEVGADLSQPLFDADASGIVGAKDSLRTVASFTTTASVVYAQFLGRASGARALNFITLITSGTASSGVTSSVGFAVSSAAPDFTAKSLTFRTSTTIDTTGSAGNKTNATAINYVPQAGEYVWVYHHVTTGTTQPTVWGIGGELGAGILQVKTSQTTAPTVGSAITFALPSAAVTVQAPAFFIR